MKYRVILPKWVEVLKTSHKLFSQSPRTDVCVPQMSYMIHLAYYQDHKLPDLGFI